MSPARPVTMGSGNLEPGRPRGCRHGGPLVRATDCSSIPLRRREWVAVQTDALLDTGRRRVWTEGVVFELGAAIRCLDAGG